jgi:flagellar hook-associated protein 2
MEIERTPITLLEDKQEYLEAQKETFTEFDSLLSTLNLAVMGLNNENDLASFEVSNSGSEIFSITTTSVTEPGTYSVEVVSLAQRQKDINNEGFADADTTKLTGELQIGDNTISYEDVTLSELVELVENGDYGVSASIINNGTDNGYKIVFTADTAGENIEILGTGDMTIDTATNGHAINGSKAHAIVDGIDYYSSSNTLTSAIHGTSITLMDISDSGSDRVTIEPDSENVIIQQLENIVSAYNEINDFVDGIYDSDPTLANSMRSVSRNLKGYLTNSSLLNLGISSDWETGSLSFDSTVLSDAYEEDPDAVIYSLLGDDDYEGIFVQFDDYIAELVNGSSGFLATKSSTIDNKIDRLNDSIESMEMRLEKRQATLEARFTIMESLISSLNSQSEYLDNFFQSESSS